MVYHHRLPPTAQHTRIQPYSSHQKAQTNRRKNINFRALTESEKRATMREKASDVRGSKRPDNSSGPAFKADQITSKRIRYGFITVQSTTLIGAQEHNLAGHQVR
ncbi:hypothetical protein TNCV_4518921 [Trichonephila clavipes]|nr:hypothetical protein TNCV_4518921 [Trichonephila clavipes]